MGNSCCQATSNSDFVQKLQKMPQFVNYQENQWPEEDKILNQWIQKQEKEFIKQKQIRKNKSENRYYIGDWDKEDNKPNGRGIYYDPNLILYDGDFKDGDFTGEAKVNLFKRHCLYEGQIENGKAKGKGSLKNSQEKYEFVGDWEDSKPSNGVMKFETDPNVEEIQFLEPANGIIRYKDHRIYKGGINPDNYQPDGLGKVQFPDSSAKRQYQGQWVEGKMHGKGKYIMRDGSYYEGQYNYGKKEGQGKFVFPSGKIYEGEWKDGNQHGLGILTDCNGKVLKQGKFENAKFVYVLEEKDFQKEKSLVYPSLSNLNQSQKKLLNDDKDERNGESLEKSDRKEQKKEDAPFHSEAKMEDKKDERNSSQKKQNKAQENKSDKKSDKNEDKNENKQSDKNQERKNEFLEIDNNNKEQNRSSELPSIIDKQSHFNKDAMKKKEKDSEQKAKKQGLQSDAKKQENKNEDQDKDKGKDNLEQSDKKKEQAPNKQDENKGNESNKKDENNDDKNSNKNVSNSKQVDKKQQNNGVQQGKP